MGKLYKCYRFVSKIIAPLLKQYFNLRCLIDKDEKDSVVNHFGQPTIARAEGRFIWIHAASIGEANSAITYVKHFKKHHPEVNVLMTTITLTSANMLREKLKAIPGCYYQFVVADVPDWINSFIDYWKFEKVIFLESEIWPNLVYELDKRQIPMYLVNARLSDRSFSRWKLLSEFMTSLLQKFTKVLPQSAIDTERFSYFYPDNVQQMDNLKYANELLPCNNDLLGAFRSFCSGRKVFVAASTHTGEEEIILKAHKLMNSVVPVSTIIIPRHVQRVKEITELCEKMQLSCSLRSQAVDGRLTSSDIFIVDTYGEVGTFYRLADVTFVGGSIVSIGGHNIFEPVAIGRPVLHGSHMHNFREVTETLHEYNVAFEVNNENDICRICLDYFNNPDKLQAVMEKAKASTDNKSLAQIDSAIQWQEDNSFIIPNDIN